jgi:hypothetical protein
MRATIGPTPKISVNVVPDAATAAVMGAVESRTTTSRCSIGEQLDRLAVPFNRRHIVTDDVVEQ